MIRGYEPKDYDYYFQSGRDFAAGRDYLLAHGGEIIRAGLSSLRIACKGKTYELLSGRWYITPEELISKFDFTACQICAVGEEVIAVRGAITDIESGTLRLAHLVDLPRTLKRAERFVSERGFSDVYNIIPEIKSVVGAPKIAAPMGPTMPHFKPVIDGWTLDKSSVDRPAPSQPASSPVPISQDPNAGDTMRSWPQETQVMKDMYLENGHEPHVMPDVAPSLPDELTQFHEWWVDYVSPTGLRAEANQDSTPEGEADLQRARDLYWQQRNNPNPTQTSAPVNTYVDIANEQPDATRSPPGTGTWSAYITDGDSSEVSVYMGLPQTYPDYESAIRAGIAAWGPIIQNIINSPDPQTWGIHCAYDDGGWDDYQYEELVGDLRQYFSQQHGPMLRRGQVHDFVEKVRSEVEGMRESGLSDIDVKLAIRQKYGEMVFGAVFE